MRTPPGPLICVISVLLVSAVHAGKSEDAKLEADGTGLQTATFDTLSGTVSVNLPEEIAAGDTISGTVVAEPEGDSDKERERNRGALAGFVLELADQRGEVRDGRLKLDIPRGEAGTVATLVLREARKGKPGREVGRVELPLRELAEAPADFRLPGVGQTGRSLVVRGRFDGDLAGTALAVGDGAAVPLAESPRMAIFRSPETIVGTVPLTLQERGEEVARGELRNVDVRLSAPKLDLKPGESTTLSTIVTGLEGLDEEIPLTLRVWPASVVQVEGGHDHDLTIRPQDVDAAGTYRLSRTVTGRVVGGWTAQATVRTPEPAAADRFVLFVEERPVGYLESVSGGTVSPAPDGGRTITFEAGFDMQRPLYDWLRESFASGPVRRNGAVVAVDSRGAQIEVHEFHQAFVSSLTLPALDAADASPARMTITIEPASVRRERGDGKPVGPVARTGQPWLGSNFRFEIGNLPLGRVTRVDAFSWKQSAGSDRGELEVRLRTPERSSWEAWHRAFAGEDRFASGALDGRLVLLGPDREERLATFELRDASAGSLAVGADECTLELVNSRVAFDHKEEVP